MLTQRSRYALRAMLFLAEAPAANPPQPQNPQPPRAHLGG